MNLPDSIVKALEDYSHWYEPLEARYPNQKLRTKFIEASILMDEALAQSPVPPLPRTSQKFPLNLANANQDELEAALDAAITDLRIFHRFGAK